VLLGLDVEEVVDVFEDDCEPRLLVWMPEVWEVDPEVVLLARPETKP